MKAIDEKYLYEVVFVCGLIGSGKTTYVMNNQAIFTDLDLIGSLTLGLSKIVHKR